VKSKMRRCATSQQEVGYVEQYWQVHFITEVERYAIHHTGPQGLAFMQIREFQNGRSNYCGKSKQQCAANREAENPWEANMTRDSFAVGTLTQLMVQCDKGNCPTGGKKCGVVPTSPSYQRGPTIRDSPRDAPVCGGTRIDMFGAHVKCVFAAGRPHRR